MIQFIIDNSSFLVNVSFIKFDFNLSTKQLIDNHATNQSEEEEEEEDYNNGDNNDEDEWK